MRALSPEVRGPMAIVAALAALVVAVPAVWYSGDVAAGGLDLWAESTVDRLLPQPGRAALLVDAVGEPLVALALVGLLAATCLLLGRRRLAVVAVVGLGLTGLVATVLLKPLVGRTTGGGFLAYPSGHTAAATVLAFVVALLVVDLLGAGRVLGLLLILGGAATAGLLMAWSQIALGAHYPTDTVGGFGTAMVVAPATAMLVDRLADSAGTRRGTARPPRPQATVTR